MVHQQQYRRDVNFVANRSTIIKNELNQASQLLYDLHVSEGLDNVITQNPPPP